MKLFIDTDAATVIVESDGQRQSWPLASAEAFDLVSRAWLRASWDAKYVYGFSWLGRPIVQLPEDLIRVQEVIYSVKPDVVIETGVAHGGSLIFYASLFKAMGSGRVIGIDVEIRPHNRQAIETHRLSPLVTLIEGSSTDPSVVAKVGSLVKPGETVLVLLDSNHSYKHVLAELAAYAPLVSVGSFIVATDGVMHQLVGAPRSKDDWASNNPRRAAQDFVAHHPDYAIEEPVWPFNEGDVKQRVTYWPDGFIKRLR